MSIGQDLEFFLEDPGGEIVPAHEFFPPKDEAIRLNADGVHCSGAGGCKIYRDGYAVEINTPGGHCRAYLWNDVCYTVKKGMEVSGAGAAGVKPILAPIASINLKELKHYPEDVKVFGCVPAYNAYTKEVATPSTNPMKAPFRSAGGHMHGSDLTQEEVDDRDFCCTLTKICDLLIGLPITVATGDELDWKRRELYGKAGEFRIKNHGRPGDRPYWGHEYRVLSPRLYRHPALTSLAFGIYRDVIMFYRKDLVPAWNPILDEPLQKAINTGKGAIELLEEWEKVLKPWDNHQRKIRRALSRDDHYSLSHTSMENLTAKAILAAGTDAAKEGDKFPTPGRWGDGHNCGWNSCMNARQWGWPLEPIPPKAWGEPPIYKTVEEAKAAGKEIHPFPNANMWFYIDEQGERRPLYLNNEHRYQVLNGQAPRGWDRLPEEHEEEEEYWEEEEEEEDDYYR